MHQYLKYINEEDGFPLGFLEGVNNKFLELKKETKLDKGLEKIHEYKRELQKNQNFEEIISLIIKETNNFQNIKYKEKEFRSKKEVEIYDENTKQELKELKHLNIKKMLEIIKKYRLLVRNLFLKLNIIFGTMEDHVEGFNFKASKSTPMTRGFQNSRALYSIDFKYLSMDMIDMMGHAMDPSDSDPFPNTPVNKLSKDQKKVIHDFIKNIPTIDLKKVKSFKKQNESIIARTRWFRFISSSDSDY